MTHTSVRPVRSDWNAIRVPSGEKNGPASIEAPGVSAVSLPLATSTVKMAGLPRLEEKNAMRAASGDQLGWKSPPRPGRHLARRAVLQGVDPDVHLAAAVRVK